jgi:hypothetical protein
MHFLGGEGEFLQSGVKGTKDDEERNWRAERHCRERGQRTAVLFLQGSVFIRIFPCPAQERKKNTQPIIFLQENKFVPKET